LKSINNGTSKISRVRYGAMKKLQLPYHRKMKQTTLNSFIAVKKKNEHQSSSVFSQKINVNSPMLNKNYIELNKI